MGLMGKCKTKIKSEFEQHKRRTTLTNLICLHFVIRTFWKVSLLYFGAFLISKEFKVAGSIFTLLVISYHTISNNQQQERDAVVRIAMKMKISDENSDFLSGCGV